MLYCPAVGHTPEGPIALAAGWGVRCTLPQLPIRGASTRSSARSGLFDFLILATLTNGLAGDATGGLGTTTHLPGLVDLSSLSSVRMLALNRLRKTRFADLIYRPATWDAWATGRRPVPPLAYCTTLVSYAPHTGRWLETPLNVRFQLWRTGTPAPGVAGQSDRSKCPVVVTWQST